MRFDPLNDFGKRMILPKSRKSLNFSTSFELSSEGFEFFGTKFAGNKVFREKVKEKEEFLSLKDKNAKVDER